MQDDLMPVTGGVVRYLWRLTSMQTTLNGLDETNVTLSCTPPLKGAWGCVASIIQFRTVYNVSSVTLLV